MQLSIGKLATISIVVLIAGTLVTTAMGLYVLQANYSTLQDRQEAEARDTVRHAAIALRNQVRFYQGKLQLMSGNPEVSNLPGSPDRHEIAGWSNSLGRTLPGTLGTALVSPDGALSGNQPALRLSPACQTDTRRFVAREPVDYPMLHTDVAGFEHFDLLAGASTPSGDDAGTLLVSFRLSVLQELLQGMARDNDRFLLLDRDGQQKLATAGIAIPKEVVSYRVPVPDTSWELILQRPIPAGSAFPTELIAANALVLISVSLLLIFLVRDTLRRFKSDITRLHTALEAALQGRYQTSSATTAIKEFVVLLPNIEHLASKIQHQGDDLRHQSLSDPLTGIFNRRHFDLMLTHLYAQSRRQPAADLVVIDLNDFKYINDDLGRPAGDRVLQQTAAFLKSRVRATDLVARLGGDEFAVILSQMADGALEDWLAALIHDYDHQVLEPREDEVPICQFSAGVAHIDAASYATAADVFIAADSAMYAVKQRRKVGHSRFAIARSGNITTIRALREAP